VGFGVGLAATLCPKWTPCLCMTRRQVTIKRQYALLGALIGILLKATCVLCTAVSRALAPAQQPRKRQHGRKGQKTRKPKLPAHGLRLLQLQPARPRHPQIRPTAFLYRNHPIEFNKKTWLVVTPHSRAAEGVPKGAQLRARNGLALGISRLSALVPWCLCG